MTLSDPQINATIIALRKRYDELVAHFRSIPGGQGNDNIKELGQIFHLRKKWLNNQKKSPPNVQNNSHPGNSMYGVTQYGLVFRTEPDGTEIIFDDDFMAIK